MVCGLIRFSAVQLAASASTQHWEIIAAFVSCAASLGFTGGVRVQALETSKVQFQVLQQIQLHVLLQVLQLVFWLLPLL